MTATFGTFVNHTIGGGWGTESPGRDDLAVRVIRGADFPQAELRDVSSLPLRFEPAKKVASRNLQDGDIVLETSGGTKDRPTGRTIRVTQTMISSSEEPIIPASFCRLIRIDSRRANPTFVYYALQDLYSRGGTWEFQNTSTGISNFQYELFQKTYSLPSQGLADQQAIAEVLGALDDKIAANTVLASAADLYLAGLFEKVFGDSPHEVPLQKIATVNERSVKPIAGGSLRYVDIASVGVGAFDYPEAISWDEAPGRARRSLHRGDTIWSTVRPNRRSHALNLSDDPSLVASTGLAVLTPRTVGFAFLYEATRRAAFTAYLENVAEGSAYPAVRADRFLDAPVPAASAQSIEAFESIAGPLRESLFAASEENRTLASTRDALLPQLMSGKLRVRDAEHIASEAGA